jgi:DNA-directed RNA polymerase subunit omega
MARVTTEDCITSIPNRFQLVIYSCRRARELLSGNEANVSLDNDKQTVIALREIADKKLDLNKIWENIVANAQKYQPAEDADIDEDQAVPLNENASQVSFDNFEKENASEKKRKKIYMTESEINKLIENRKSEKGDGEDIEDEFDDADDIEEKMDPNPEEDTKK